MAAPLPPALPSPRLCHAPCHAPLGRVEKDLSKFAASQPRRADGPFAELLPWLLDQAHDWEVAATANAAGDTPAARALSPLRLFATTPDR